MIVNIPVTERIKNLRERTMSEERFLSLEQAKIITRVYRENEGLPVCIKRAKALACSLREMAIAIDPFEIIVGNRTSGVRSGVVFPEAGISWLVSEIETLPVRPQDRFQVKPADIRIFREEIEPYWRGKTLEDPRVTLYQKLDPGVYYWKISVKGKLQAIGKFYVK